MKLGTVFPKIQAVETNEPFSIACYTNDDKVEWMLNGRKLRKKHNRVLTISNAWFNEGGSYICRGRYKDESGTIQFSDTAKVLVGRK